MSVVCMQCGHVSTRVPLWRVDIGVVTLQLTRVPLWRVPLWRVDIGVVTLQLACVPLWRVNIGNVALILNIWHLGMFHTGGVPVGSAMIQVTLFPHPVLYQLDGGGGFPESQADRGVGGVLRGWLSGLAGHGVVGCRARADVGGALGLASFCWSVERVASVEWCEEVAPRAYGPLLGRRALELTMNHSVRGVRCWFGQRGCAYTAFVWFIWLCAHNFGGRFLGWMVVVGRSVTGGGMVLFIVIGAIGALVLVRCGLVWFILAWFI